MCKKCCKAIHLARNCDEEVSCTECGSKTHVAALHLGPAPRVNNSGPAPENGGGTAVSTTCTKVCEMDISGRSCSIICLVRVYPADHPDAALRMYVTLDDQSNRSLARAEFFSLFGISGHPSPYSLKTCAGTIETAGRQARGFMVEPIDGYVALTLPQLIATTHPRARPSSSYRAVVRHVELLRHNQSTQSAKTSKWPTQRTLCPKAGSGLGGRG